MTKTTKRPGRAAVALRPVETLIRVIRGQKVVLDADLAVLYRVETKALNQAVHRNPARFPENFMFRLTQDEASSLRSQIVTLNVKRGRGQHVKYEPFAFTEHGVVMLSSVLRSERAVEMSIHVVNAFVRIREILASNKDIAARVEKLERGHKLSTSVIEVLVEDIDHLTEEVKVMKRLPSGSKRKIGFQA